MRARDDLDKADVTAIMESARRKVKQEGLSDVPEGGITVVGRVEAAHAGGLGLFAGRLNLGTGTIRVPEGARAAGGWNALAASARLMGANWRNANTIPPVQGSKQDDE